ncbi:hypothetical protein THMIRHAM_01090 [Thiomicrorhabdus immobilis]|uniref:Uncharacterized protein n=1 Tax=Thiomicrorhabdus immobilis TaxID=2791037 RepID=A0ABN6CUY4_9GAMM|nr:hypothetical protein [Thiomicrorhabdus immobilis]BCN92324.1 hypothetical protein THMIRHAM_01090 [Thiomicrorhabdus immobilis]
MHLIENKYETAGLLKLPPHARDIAEHLLTLTPLNELLLMWQADEPNQDLLHEHRVPEKLWPEIINATLLAKTTYFLPNPNFTKEELLYLMKAACSSIGLPLNLYSVKEVIEMSREEYPIFSEWLKTFANLLKQKR